MLNRIIKLLYILVPLAVIAIIGLDFFSYYSGIVFNILSDLRELVILSLIFLCYRLIKSKFHFNELTIEQNLARLSLLILINFIISLLTQFIFDPSYSTGFPAKYDSAGAVIASTLMAITASFTMVPALFILKELIFYKRKRNTAIIFNLFIIVITLNAISVYFSQQNVGWWQFSELTIYNDITFTSVILFVVILSFRNEWITFLSRKRKIIYFIAGIPILVAIAVLPDIVYLQSLPAYSLTIAAFTFNMWIFLLIYGIFAVLYLLIQIQTARVFDRKIKELNSLYDLGRMLNSETKLEKLPPLITKLTSQVLESQSTWLAFYDHEEKQFNIASQINLSKEELFTHPLLRREGLNENIFHRQKAKLINDVPHHRQYRQLLDWKKDARTILGAPLFSNRGQLMGIIYATKVKEYTFDIDDISLIQGVANQAAVAIENAQLLQESIKRERLEQELKIARDVQLKLLPQSIPSIENFDIDAFCLSAYEVGGDYYDFFYFSDGNPGIIIGDVSGKGTSAALYMAEFKGIIQSLAKSHDAAFSLTCDINEMIFPNIERKSFVSAIVAKIDPINELITFTRAGHTPILYCSGNNDQPQSITTKGIGLGLDPGTKFNHLLEEYTLELNGQGTIILYTDGVIEARNHQGHEYGEDRLIQLMKECKGDTAEQIKERLANSVVDFCGNTPLHDDLTFIILKNCKHSKLAKVVDDIGKN
jgi:serine phosphatase RsbU (regulator of sigma subunit)